MNMADLELLEKQIAQSLPADAILESLKRIERDLNTIIERVNVIEEAAFPPPSNWDDGEDDNMPEFPF